MAGSAGKCIESTCRPVWTNVFRFAASANITFIVRVGVLPSLLVNRVTFVASSPRSLSHVMMRSSEISRSTLLKRATFLVSLIRWMHRGTNSLRVSSLFVARTFGRSFNSQLNGFTWQAYSVNVPAQFSWMSFSLMSLMCCLIMSLSCILFNFVFSSKRRAMVNFGWMVFRASRLFCGVETIGATDE